MDTPNIPNVLKHEPQTPPVEPSELSFQVMPHSGGSPSNLPITPTPSSGLTDELEPMPDPSSGRKRIILIIVGVVILIILGIVAFFLLGSKKSNNSTNQAAVSKLPKVWLQQYFSANLNSDQSCNDKTICGDDADFDQDGLTNFQEFSDATNPTKADTDGDGLADGDEVNIYKTDPTLKYTDRREIVAQNDWSDAYQIKNGYDPLTPGLKMTDARKQQIADDTSKYGLHEPTKTSLMTDSSLSSPAPTSGSPAPAAVSTQSVTIQNFAFSPENITINKGDTVTWTNKDSSSHNITSDDSKFTSSSNLATNQTYSFTFTTSGTYTYHCSIHPSMTGTVTVQ